MLEQALLIVIMILVGIALYMIIRLHHASDNNNQLLDPINTLTGHVKKLQADNQQLLASLQSQQKLLLQLEAKQAQAVVVTAPPIKPTEKPLPPFSTLSMAKVAIKKPELPIDSIMPDVLDMPVLVASLLMPSDRPTNEPLQKPILTPPDYQDALRQAVNSLLQQQARINTQQITEQLKKMPEIPSTLSVQTGVYYLDGTPSEALAELVVIVFNEQRYVVPHYNSFSNPYLSRWFDLSSTQQVTISEWPVISFNDDSKAISCIQKGKINL